MISFFNGSVAVAPVSQAPSSYYHVAGVTAGHLCKTGLGSFRRLCVNGAASGTVVTVYDGTSTGGAVMAVVTTSLPLHMEYFAQFNAGLFVVVAGASSDITITWE